MVSRTMTTSSTCGYHRALRRVLDGRDESLLCGCLPTPGGFEEEEDEQEDDLLVEMEDADEEELEDSREDGLFGQEEEFEEVQEAREVKTRALPKGPSEEQMRVHQLTHYPFRNWCPECVAGGTKN